MVKNSWISPEVVLQYFNKELTQEFIKTTSYKDFVENYKKDSGEVLGELTLE